MERLTLDGAYTCRYYHVLEIVAFVETLVLDIDEVIIIWEPDLLQFLAFGECSVTYLEDAVGYFDTR